MNFIIIQLLGAIAYTFLTISYFKKEKKSILFLQIIAYVFFAIHYLLLSGITGAICNIIGLITLITIYTFKKYKLSVSIILILILIVINIITFQNIYSIFPMIASIIAIVSFLMDDENIIREYGIIAAVSWLIYAVVYKSYISIIYEVITLIGVVIAFIKNKKEGKYEKQVK